MLLDAVRWIVDHPRIFLDALETHLLLSGAALALAIALAAPLGVALTRYPRAAFATINGAGAMRTIPSIAVLAIMLPFLGIGFKPSLVALTILAVPPILINTYVGVRQVDPDIVDSARGMGMTGLQSIFRVELPLAAPVMFAGIRTSAVQVIAGATLAAFIGGGGLGDFITAGIAIMDLPRLLVGAVPIALLAILTEFAFGGLERVMFRRG
ncbi:MAG TPA: ABC transporter permease [Alphaproteobacteria bacterium]|jgi:osmoprotectant transport system permease protein|nr:ABC transporter permease [Alphaproteobacteria bacterium]